MLIFLKLEKLGVSESDMFTGIKESRQPTIIDSGVLGRYGFGLRQDSPGLYLLILGYVGALVEAMYEIVKEEQAQPA